MQSPSGIEELARRVVPVARKHGVNYVSLIPPQQNVILDEDGRLHLLLNLDGTSAKPDFDALARELQRSVGSPVELYTLESIRHSPYGKDVIRQSVMLTMD